MQTDLIDRRKVLGSLVAISVAGCGGGMCSAPPPAADPAATLESIFPSTSAFVDGIADSYLSRFVKALKVENGQPDHQYVLNYETARLPNSRQYRVRFYLRDETLQSDVACWTKQSQCDFSLDHSATILLSQGALPNYTGITATAWLDWSAIDWNRISLTTYTRPDQAGIRPEHIITRAEITRRFKDNAEPAIRLTVGSGQPNATHFNSFAAALRSLYIPGVEITRLTYPCSNTCTFSHQVLIECVDSQYGERITAATLQNVDQSVVLLPPFVTLRGRGDTRLFMDPGANTAPVIEAPFSFRLENLIVENLGAGYTVHIDNENDLSRRTSLGPAMLNYSIVSVMKNVSFMGSARQSNWLIGCGISNGQLIRLEGCSVIAAAAKPMFGAHTSPNTTDAATIEVVASTFNDLSIAGAVAIQLVKSHDMSVQHTLMVRDTQLGHVEIGSFVAGPAGFVDIS